MSTNTSADREYVLGTHDEELERLGFQHQLWRSHAYALWERANFKSGDRLLDVGCGPGFTTADLAHLAGAAGQVTGVDVSSKFIEYVRSRNLPNVEALLDDVQAMQLPESNFDGAYARWVLCFVPEPHRVVECVAKSLKPGGRFVIQDYYYYRAIKFAPHCDVFQRVTNAVDKSWRQHGGDPEIGCRLPTMLSKAGLRVTHLAPLLRLGRSGSSLWDWPATFFRIYIPSLIKMGLLTPNDHAEFTREWEKYSRDPNAFFTSPPMIEIIAEK